MQRPNCSGMPQCLNSQTLGGSRGYASTHMQFKDMESHVSLTSCATILQQNFCSCICRNSCTSSWILLTLSSQQGHLPCVLLSSPAFLLTTAQAKARQLLRHWRCMSLFMYSKLCLQAGVPFTCHSLPVFKCNCCCMCITCFTHMSCAHVFLASMVSNTSPLHSSLP